MGRVGRRGAPLHGHCGSYKMLLQSGYEYWSKTVQVSKLGHASSYKQAGAVKFTQNIDAGELVCLACELASRPHRSAVRGGDGSRTRRLVVFARLVVQSDTCSLAVSGQETRHVRSRGGTTAHTLRMASTHWWGGVSQGGNTRVLASLGLPKPSARHCCPG